jgi:hypothetical protein
LFDDGVGFFYSELLALFDGRVHHLVKNNYEENSEVYLLVKEIIKSKSYQ